MTTTMTFNCTKQQDYKFLDGTSTHSVDWKERFELAKSCLSSCSFSCCRQSEKDNFKDDARPEDAIPGTRNDCDEIISSKDENFLLFNQCFINYFPLVTQLLFVYLNHIASKETNEGDDDSGSSSTTERPLFENIPQDKQVPNEKTSHIQTEEENCTKDLIRNVRNALRFIRICIQPKWDSIIEKHSIKDDVSKWSKTSLLHVAQNAAVKYHIHIAIAYLLKFGKHTHGDKKCINEGSKILCNIVTSNKHTSYHLTKQFGSSLSLLDAGRGTNSKWNNMEDTFDIYDNHQGHFSLNENTDGNEINLMSNKNLLLHQTPTWLDMLLGCITCLETRDSIGRIAATLYNIISAMTSGEVNEETKHKENNDNIDKNDNAHLFSTTLAKDRLLMCNFVRHTLPTTAIDLSNKQQEGNNVIDEGGGGSGYDATTEWISLLFYKLCIEQGLLSLVHESLGAANFASQQHDSTNLDNANDNTNSYHHSSLLFVSMEHVVLYQSLVSSISKKIEMANDTTNSAQCSTLHRKGANASDNLCFIATLSGKLLKKTKKICIKDKDVSKVRHSNLVTNNVNNEQHISDCSTSDLYDGEDMCRNTVVRCMYEILSLYLHNAQHYDNSNNIRKVMLCERTTLMMDLINIMYDIIQRVTTGEDNDATSSSGSNNNRTPQHSEEPTKKRSRDMKMSRNDQWWIKMAVELIGCLCYQNTIGQNMLRHIEIDTSSGNTILKNNITNSNPSKTETQEQTTNTTKNGLHILLETSTMSLACFGLRERVVVSVRYALENNMNNQKILEQLSPQEALMSPELSSMGINNLRIDEEGKVRVSKANN